MPWRLHRRGRRARRGRAERRTRTRRRRSRDIGKAGPSTATPTAVVPTRSQRSGALAALVAAGQPRRGKRPSRRCSSTRFDESRRGSGAAFSEESEEKRERRQFRCDVRLVFRWSKKKKKTRRNPIARSSKTAPSTHHTQNGRSGRLRNDVREARRLRKGQHDMV